MTGGDGGDRRAARATHVVLASGSVPRTIPGFEVDGTHRADLRRGAVARQAAGVGGGHRRRRHRLRVRLDDDRPRHAGHDPRGAAQDPPGLRQRRRQRRRCARSRSAASTCAPASPSTGHSRTRRRHHRAASATARRSTSTLVVVSVGRRPLSDGLGLDGTAVEVDERGFVVVDECCRTGEPGVYAVGDLIATPQLAHVGFAEGDRRRSRTSSARTRSRSTTARCRGASTAIPRSRSPGYSEEAAKEAGFDVVVVEAPLRRQRPGADRRRDRGLVKIIAEKRADGKRRADPRRAHGRARGSPSSSARATWPSTGRPPSTRSPTSSSRTRRCRELFGESVLALTGTGACTAAWLTSRCPSSVRPSPRAPSPSGSSRSATRSPRTRSLFEVSTDKVDSEVPSPVGRLPHRDPRARGRHRRRRHGARRDLRRSAVQPHPRRRRLSLPLHLRGRARARARSRRRSPRHRRRRRLPPAAPPTAPGPAAGGTCARSLPRPPSDGATGNRLLSPVVRRLISRPRPRPARSTAPASAAASPARTCSRTSTTATRATARRCCWGAPPASGRDSLLAARREAAARHDVDIVLCDILDPQQVDTAVSQADMIVHCAKTDDRPSIVDGTHNLLQLRCGMTQNGSSLSAQPRSMGHSSPAPSTRAALRLSASRSTPTRRSRRRHSAASSLNRGCRQRSCGRRSSMARSASRGRPTWPGGCSPAAGDSSANMGQV